MIKAIKSLKDTGLRLNPHPDTDPDPDTNPHPDTDPHPDHCHVSVSIPTILQYLLIKGLMIV